MPAPSDRSSTSKPALGPGREWLGKNSVWQISDLEISGIKSWPFMTAVSYHRNGGETIWRGARHRLALTLDPIPSYVFQVEQGRTGQRDVGAGDLGFFPADIEVRIVAAPALRLIQVLWDTGVYSTLLPELGAAASQFEYVPLKDRLLSQIVTSLARENEGGFADRIMIESLGTAMCIQIAQHFVGHLQLPTGKGLSSERLQRVRDYVEAHLDDDLSLTVLADIACLSPYHFSRSFKQAVGIGPQRFVIQRRLERAKTLLRRTRNPLALIALQVGFADQSHLTTVFHRETGVTPGRFRAELT